MALEQPKERLVTRFATHLNHRNYAMYSRWWQLKYFFFSPRTLGKVSNLTSIFFKKDWNHQLVFFFRSGLPYLHLWKRCDSKKFIPICCSEARFEGEDRHVRFCIGFTDTYSQTPSNTQGIVTRVITFIVTGFVWTFTLPLLLGDLFSSCCQISSLGNWILWLEWVLSIGFYAMRLGHLRL